MIIPPIQKAEELFDKFFALYPDQDAYWMAKEGALFSVDEIIESRKDDRRFDDRLIQSGSKYASLHPMGLSYWLEVKKQLNKK